MKKVIKKTTTWLLIVCTIFAFTSVFGPAAAADAKEPESVVAFAVPQSDDADEPTSGGLFGALLEWLKSIGLNLQSVSVDDILNLPANAMDDVVTYIFAFLKMIGINIDALYEKVSALPLFR